MSKMSYQDLMRNLPRSEGGTGTEKPARISLEGCKHIRISGVAVEDCYVAFDASNSEDVLIEDTKINRCLVPVIGHGTTNLSVLNMEIDGFKLTDFTGDFDFLAVMSADEILFLGQMLSDADFRCRTEILKSSKLGVFLQKRSFGDWLGLAGFLTGLAGLVI